MRKLSSILIAATSLVLASSVRIAGNCTAELDGDDLVIEGDDLDNCIDVAETSPGSGEFVITGLNGTTVNGMPSDTVSGVTGDIEFDGGDGLNEICLHDSVVLDDVEIENGAGGSVTVIVTCLILGEVEIENGEGFDELVLENTEVLDDVVICNGNGDPLSGEGSATDIEAWSLIHGSLYIQNQDGFDEFSMEDSRVEGDAMIFNGDGNIAGDGSETDFESDDVSFFQNTIAGDLCLVNGAGFDELDVEDATILGEIYAYNGSGGSGTDIEGAFIGHHVEIENEDGLDEFNLDNSLIEGYLEIDNKDGGSEILFEGPNEIGNDLKIEADVGDDSIEMDTLTVGGETSVETGADDDTLIVGNSIFRDDFEADGGDQVIADVFEDSGGNAFEEDLDLEDFEVETLPLRGFGGRFLRGLRNPTRTLRELTRRTTRLVGRTGDSTSEPARFRSR